MSVRSIMRTIKGHEPKFHPNCVFLSTETMETKWTYVDTLEPGDSVAWSSYVELRDLGLTVLVATDAKVRAEDGPPCTYPPCSWSNVPQLKSLVQKAVRRSKTALALTAFTHLLSLNEQEALRRLAIIAVEDALPLHGYATLVWLMMATSKGYRLTEKHVQWLLGYVYALSECRYYEQFDKDAPLRNNRDTVKRMRLAHLSDQHGRNLCYSLATRKGYGGMKGDEEMMLSATLMWSIRFSTSSSFVDLLCRAHPVYATVPTEPLTAAEWLHAAVDFHCNPNILQDLQCYHSELSYEQIKLAIWHCSSCITDKQLIGENQGQRNWDSEDHKAVWAMIRKNFFSLARKNLFTSTV